MSKQVLWDCINVYTAAMGTEHEKRERAVLDQAIDAALADSGTADAPPKEDRYMHTLGIPMRDSIEMALAELGEPQPKYPAPVATAVEILRNALAFPKEAPPSDAAQPEVSEERVRSLLWSMPNYHHIGDAVLTEQSEWLCEKLRAILHAHPEDAPGGPTAEQIAKILCPGYSHTLRGLRSPKKVKADFPCSRCVLWGQQIRYALNRLKGDKNG